MAPSESDPIISLLKNSIQLSNYTYRDVERQLGWRVGTITRLMRGGLGLKVEHLLSILRVIQFSPGRFFAAAYPPSPDAPAMENRLHRMLEQMHGHPEVADPAGGREPTPTKQDEIDAMVRASLRKLIGAAGPGAAGEKPNS